MMSKSYARTIELPSENFFPNLKTARRFAMDIGGSLAKVAYCSTIQRRTSLVFDEENSDPDHIYNISEAEEVIIRLHFVKFETKYIETCLDFVQKNLIQSKPSFMKDKCIKVTGGGAYKYKDLITAKLGVEVDKEDEMSCLIKGCNFLLKNIPDEAFNYQRHGNPEYQFQGTDPDIFPYLLVNIGSGVSLVKVESENKFERIGGTSTGGGTFWGLGSLLTSAKTFDELLELASRGDHRSCDMLVKDIYGGSYPLIGLSGDVIASSFGKAARPNKDHDKVFSEEDIARSLLLCISNDIGQIAFLHAKIHGLRKIYFGGYFIRGHPFTMHTITYAINYWSKGEIQAMYLRHEGYLGAIGGFLKGTEEEDEEKYSWGEHFVGSSGLASPSQAGFMLGTSKSSKFDLLELDRLDKPLLPCPLLLDSASYIPDTVDLTKDADARQYWLQCFSESVETTWRQALKSQPSCADAERRAHQFRTKYLDRLSVLKENPCCYGSLTVRCLLDMSSQYLAENLFTDPYSQLKKFDNEYAMKFLVKHLAHIDSLSWHDRQLELTKGLLAGNVFDIGAKEIRKILDAGKFGFEEAKGRLQKRPWLFDDFDEWKERLLRQPPHKCAVIFCDNSGFDIILGIFPFARELLSRGTKVILCANSKPTLNDVTYSELMMVARHIAAIQSDIYHAMAQNKLVVMASGQGSPCLDLRLIDESLVRVMREQEADLIILEGMGRAVHTNFHAAFSCEALKVAVIKNKWLANRLGGDMFNVMFKYEKARRVSASTKLAS
ncbi:4'-phosphopantetheine phosphatase-like [Gigantopelta aegis]|uniref:4'-phosphopantetheine phosphatase-like n=1 Tax=Gigantopelta aegis TaxID=1735272 RepID=UPI001B88E429|nr:4'-phosphopantetheine phosphatase-like [Gigantopelta aegis]XP_041357835.1 4'-phosphopantetheine phosphatase-like [Gigantopelta aegis]XP_041357843.1 4'-phosphopantetheine phosphatase-like [Gigantopelta aegis]